MVSGRQLFMMVSQWVKDPDYWGAPLWTRLCSMVITCSCFVASQVLYPGMSKMIKTGNLRVVFGDGEDSLIGDGTGDAIEMRIHKVHLGGTSRVLAEQSSLGWLKRTVENGSSHCYMIS